MTRRTSIALSALVATAAFLAGAYVSAQVPSTPAPTPDSLKQLERRLAALDTPSGTWKELAPDVRLLVSRSEHGGYKARLYVLIGDNWQPVAAEGIGDLQRILPAK